MITSICLEVGQSRHPESSALATTSEVASVTAAAVALSESAVQALFPGVGVSPFVVDSLAASRACGHVLSDQSCRAAPHPVFSLLAQVHPWLLCGSHDQRHRWVGVLCFSIGQVSFQECLHPGMNWVTAPEVGRCLHIIVVQVNFLLAQPQDLIGADNSVVTDFLGEKAVTDVKVQFLDTFAKST